MRLLILQKLRSKGFSQKIVFFLFIPSSINLMWVFVGLEIKTISTFLSLKILLYVLSFIILIENCEYARFTPASNVKVKNDYENAVKVISEIDKQIQKWKSY